MVVGNYYRVTNKRSNCLFYLMKNPLNKKEEEAYLKKLGERLRYFRKKKHSNYEYFAYEIGMSRTQYGAYENGRNIQFSTLLNLLKALDVSIEEFFAEGFN